MNKVALESIVIVTNQYGSIATIRFNNPFHDKIISASSKPSLHTLINLHLKSVLNG